MDKILNQLRRIYTDDGRSDVDFTDREIALQAAKDRLAAHTQELVRAAERLNRSAIRAGFPKGAVH